MPNSDRGASYYHLIYILFSFLSKHMTVSTPFRVVSSRFPQCIKNTYPTKTPLVKTLFLTTKPSQTPTKISFSIQKTPDSSSTSVNLQLTEDDKDGDSNIGDGFKVDCGDLGSISDNVIALGDKLERELKPVEFKVEDISLSYQHAVNLPLKYTLPPLPLSKLKINGQTNGSCTEPPKGLAQGNLSEELKKVLFSVAAKWGDVIDFTMLKVIHLKGAMTNEVYRITWPTKTDNVSRNVILRIYGEGVDLLFDRDEEIQTFDFMSKHGYGPRLLGQFTGGRVEEFIYAKTLSASDLRDPETSALIAAKLRKFHTLNMPGSKNVILWDRMRNWLTKARNLCSDECAKEFHLDTLADEIHIVEQELKQSPQDVVFCHNDLQYGNILIDEKTSSMTIIDYEYAGYNPVAYDLAKHFCEMAADYHSETPHILNYNIYPGLEERERFVRSYLSSTGHEPSETEVKRLVNDVEKYTLANHLFWGLWGIISAHVNNIDFNYMEYARQRFEQYWLRKPQLLPLATKSNLY